MKIFPYSLRTFGGRRICIGKQGENLATRIDVDVTPWKTEYPTGIISLFVVPPAGSGYLAALEENGNTVRWTIRDTDTAYDGHGKAELILTDASGTVMKSITAYTTCAKSVSAAEPADPPEAIRPWVEQILEAIKSGDVSAEAIAAAVEAYIKEHGVQVEETDPTVPEWAKQPKKPTYTASEVGALPSSYTPPVASVNGKTGAVALSAQDVRARPDTWTPSASEVGADAAGTASGAVAAHNTSGAAHADLRALIEGLTGRLNALADSDDTTLDQLSEIVAYIKSNKSLIDAVTTGKVSVSDIVDNLTTNASGKVLSAAQGVALKAMIDGIVIPTALPNPQPIIINGQRYDGSEAVTVTVSSEGGGTPVEIDDTLTQSGKAADAKAVGDQLSALNKAKANEADLAKVAKSGSYNDLTDKPTIPAVPSALPNPNALTFTGAVNETYDGSAAKSVSIPTIPESLKNPNKLILSGAVTAEYDGSAEVSVEIPTGGGSAYELPIASATQLGGVMPAAKTDEMTQAVGVDETGGLWTMAGGGDTIEPTLPALIVKHTLTEDEATALTFEYSVESYPELANYTDLLIEVKNAENKIGQYWYSIVNNEKPYRLDDNKVIQGMGCGSVRIKIKNGYFAMGHSNPYNISISAPDSEPRSLQIVPVFKPIVGGLKKVGVTSWGAGWLSAGAMIRIWGYNE